MAAVLATTAGDLHGVSRHRSWWRARAADLDVLRRPRFGGVYLLIGSLWLTWALHAAHNLLFTAVGGHPLVLTTATVGAVLFLAALWRTRGSAPPVPLEREVPPASDTVEGSKGGLFSPGNDDVRTTYLPTRRRPPSIRPPSSTPAVEDGRHGLT
jgi:hypothetical protein